MTGEKVLIARAKKGEIAAFESLMTAYENRIYSLALRSTGSEQDAADITQEVFLRAWKNLDSFRGDSSLSTWLYRVTSNLCVDFARKKAAEGMPTSIDDEESPAADFVDPSRMGQPEAAAENSELRGIALCPRSAVRGAPAGDPAARRGGHDLHRRCTHTGTGSGHGQIPFGACACKLAQNLARTREHFALRLV